MESLASQSFGLDWSLARRSAAYAGAALVVGLACFGFYLTSRQRLDEREPVAHVDVVLSPRVTQFSPPPRPRHAPEPARTAPQVASNTAPATSDADRAVLAQMLVCFGPHRNEHPECRSLRANADTSPAPLAIGPHSDRDVAVNPRDVMTPGEAMTIVTPRKCAPVSAGAMAQACGSFYPDPPPPSRTAEQICQDANTGGPCTPPIVAEPQHVHRTPTTRR